MKISDFHNIHSGKRCFILGNGPSLTKIDLSKLKDEITFGTNEIYRLPDINLTYFTLGTVDWMNFDSIVNLECEAKFISRRLFPFKRYDNVVLVKLLDTPRILYSLIPNFSLDCNKCVYTGGTISHINIQLAAYMGCNPIYLVGVDWWDKEDNCSMISKHFYGDGGVKNTLSKYDEKFTLSIQNGTMKVADKILKKNNIKVYNLTSGTKLKAFEVRDFDNVLSM